ncbi:diaminopimelate decarboxylase [Paraphotobacterium marinum]|uniref:Diaminopimelate decarboxylase n=1 Tax=Paraphotobacterium marinum TaxID=1755811 RepID=A0A220VD68_9GAMM|nr:diaminopimelate decarboxylase [Paraphotobacterium marinum]ASK78176.1 diaminopimelate decarboxylase [Paraphotobacterium marinum]
MDYFEFKDHELWCEDVKLSDVAKKFGTPLYVYSKKTFLRHYQAFTKPLSSHPHLICYSVKVNSNIAILNCLARAGSGFDIVSGGELERVIRAGGDPKKVVFSGVGKTRIEIENALNVGIKSFNVESRSELDLINKIAKELGKIAPISIRVNPDVDAETHPYITTGLKDNKFGISYKKAIDEFVYADSLENIEVEGVDCHIGSQLTKLSPFEDALSRVLALVDNLKQKGLNIKHIDLGGGLGVVYDKENPPLPSEYSEKILQQLRQYPDMELILEPGRAIAANAGVLLTEVLTIKENEAKNFAIVDAAMNDLIRPTLYNAWQKIVPLKLNNKYMKNYDVVGPICETGDFLGKDRKLSIVEGDYLAIKSAGAYGFVMSSNYNSRGRAAEIFIDESKVFEIRKRENIDNLLELEVIPNFDEAPNES